MHSLVLEMLQINMGWTRRLSMELRAILMKRSEDGVLEGEEEEDEEALF